MATRFSSLILAVSSLAMVGLGGCDRTVEASAVADVRAETPPPVRPGPDPAAPAPGTQAAEAIGADSSSEAPPAPPQTQRP